MPSTSLAIIIFLAQLSQFKIANAGGVLQWMQGPALYLLIGLVVLTMAIIYLLPKLTMAFPSALAAILVVTALVHGLNLDTRTVGDLASVAGGLPSFHLPMVALTWETLLIILPYAVILAAIGLIESLMTLTLIDEATETRGRGNRECIGQGVANVVTGFFGGMGGCAMIGQSIININSGGRGRLSGITAALCLLSFIVFASNLIEMIPVAALVGVMFMVVIDFRGSRVCDHSGLEAVSSLTERYLGQGEKLRLKHLSSECRLLLANAGSMIEVNVIEDPRYRVAVDELA